MEWLKNSYQWSSFNAYCTIGAIKITNKSLVESVRSSIKGKKISRIKSMEKFVCSEIGPCLLDNK